MGAKSESEDESTFMVIKREDIVFEGRAFGTFCVDIIMAFLRSKVRCPIKANVCELAVPMWMVHMVPTHVPEPYSSGVQIGR